MSARILALSLVTGLGCAAPQKAKPQDRSKPAPPPTAEQVFAAAARGGPPKGYQPGSGPAASSSHEESPAGMKVEREDMGFLAQKDADEPIRRRWSDFTQCYEQAGDAQRYAGGRVKLRFLVGADGKPSDVLVVETRLGNWEVERCLVEVGKTLRFKPPLGGKPTNFDYPVEFRSSRQMKVVEWPAERLEKELLLLAPKLDACGCLGPSAITATLYVEPRAKVRSVGFASDGPLDPVVGACAVDQVRSWRLPPEPAGRVGRVVATIPPATCSPWPAAAVPAR